MKIDELQLGDWVQVGECGHYKGVYAKVWWLSQDSNHVGLFDTCVFSECEDDVLPIPLTSEILEKNGWEKQRAAIIGSDHYYQSVYGSAMKCDNSDRWFVIVDGDNESASVPMRFAHQLQHAFRLLGVEKKIEI